MFSRAFMRQFDKMKYRNLVEPFGNNCNVRVRFWPDIEVAHHRLIAYVFTTLAALKLYKDPSFLFELAFHPHYPVHEPRQFNSGIPNHIIEANEGPSQQLLKMKQTALLIKSFQSFEDDIPVPSATK